MLTDDMLPCPFCGGTNLHIRAPFEDDAETMVVDCDDCNATGPYYGGSDSTQHHEAMTLWNARAQSKADAARITALEAEIAVLDKAITNIATLSNPDWDGARENPAATLDSIHAETAAVIVNVLRRNQERSRP